MAKEKLREPYAQLVASFKKNALGPWGPRSKQIVAAIEKVRGGTLEEVYGTSFLAASVLTQQEADRFPEIQLRMSKSPRSARMTLHADAWAAWERHPKTVELSDDAVAQFNLYDGDLDSASLDKLLDLFPGCLLIDIAALNKTYRFPDETIKGAFVFPSVDTQNDVLSLRYVALLQEDIRSATTSYLHLDANTIGEARKRTYSREERYWAQEESKLGPFDPLQGLGNAVMRGHELLNEVVDRILALFLSGVYVAEESMDGGVCHIKFRTAAEVEKELVLNTHRNCSRGSVKT